MRRVICPFCDPCGFFGALSSSTPFGSFQVNHTWRYQKGGTIRGAIARQPPRSLLAPRFERHNISRLQGLFPVTGPDL